MTDLIKASKEINQFESLVKLAKLDNSESMYLKAKQSDKFYDLNDNERYNKCLEIILSLFFNLNKDSASPSAQSEIKALTTCLINEITTYFIGISIAEIELCFANGIREVYGKYFGLNTVTFHNWLKAYETDEKRIKMLNKVSGVKKIEASFKPKEVTNEDFIECITQDWTRLHEGKNIQTFKMFYDWMYNNYEGFKPSNEDREEIIEMVKLIEIERLKAEKVNKYANKELIQSEIDGIVSGGLNTPFINLCKIEYYKRFLLNCEDLKF